MKEVIRGNPLKLDVQLVDLSLMSRQPAPQIVCLPRAFLGCSSQTTNCAARAANLLPRLTKGTN